MCLLLNPYVDHKQEADVPIFPLDLLYLSLLYLRA